MHAYWLSSIVAAASSAVLFFAVFALGLGFLFLQLPTLPLLMLGLSRGFQPLLAAVGGAGLLIAAIGSSSAFLVYISALAVPVLLFAPAALTLDRDGSMAWQKTGALLTDITLYMGLVFLFVEAHLFPTGGVQASMENAFRRGVETLDPSMQSAILDMAAGSTFFMLGVAVWWWVLLFYAHAWAANRLLARKNTAVRRSLALEPFSLPAWHLALLGAAALLASSGGTIAFAAKVLLIIFLLPYFLLGASVAARAVKEWPNSGFWLFMLYAVSLALFWPALGLAGFGVLRQCRELTAKPTA